MKTEPEMKNSIPIRWNKHEFLLMAEKVIFWQKQNVLFVADPHFGKAATFRNSGIPVPEENTLEDCNLLSHLVQKTKAETIIFLGDFFHARSGKTDKIRKILLNWRKKNSNIHIHLIRGNHDLNSGDPWPELRILSHPDPSTILEVECRHLPIKNPKKPYLAGHIHPGFSLTGSGKGSIRSACFLVNSKYIILPAFGTFTGLKNVKPVIGDQIFLTNGKEIINIPSNH